MRLRLDDEGDGDDPILSLVNLIDVFLVVQSLLPGIFANTTQRRPSLLAHRPESQYRSFLLACLVF